jgi:2,4-dienoyl-CoA reductase-like NADH-dependent reductase (Old Yellow Enzyme family)
MTSALFSPLDIGPVRVPNRIAIGPMCQYSANDGCATDWHMQMAMNYGMSGAGAVILEATGVTREGRISLGCLGLYSDACEYALGRVMHAARAVSLPGTKFGVQIGHAGRKASTHNNWSGSGPLAPHESAWRTVSASPIPYADGWHVPAELTDAEILSIIDSFAEAAKRAVRLGFDIIELHAAHGYLIHQFQSPICNKRTDRWGGDAAGRNRFPLAVADALRDSVPEHVALGARITGTDYVDGGLTVEDGVAFAKALKARRFSYVCVSSGNIVQGGRPATTVGFNVPNAARVRRETGIVVRTGGLIAEAHQAEDIVANQGVDQIAIARAQRDDPRWGWRAAEKLGVKLELPPPMRRVTTGQWTGLQLVRPQG